MWRGSLDFSEHGSKERLVAAIGGYVSVSTWPGINIEHDEGVRQANIECILPCATVGNCPGECVVLERGGGELLQLAVAEGRGSNSADWLGAFRIKGAQVDCDAGLSKLLTVCSDLCGREGVFLEENEVRASPQKVGQVGACTGDVGDVDGHVCERGPFVRGVAFGSWRGGGTMSKGSTSRS